jgi:hypothetical protein
MNHDYTPDTQFHILYPSELQLSHRFWEFSKYSRGHWAQLKLEKRTIPMESDSFEWLGDWDFTGQDFVKKVEELQLSSPILIAQEIGDKFKNYLRLW